MQNDPAIQQFLLEDVQEMGQLLGTGAYGSVEALQMQGMVCAGKKIHDILFDSSPVEQLHVTQTFARECSILSSLRHPHVVQFLGLCFLPHSTSQLPLLVMEYLPMSLDDCLSHSKSTEKDHVAPIPLSLKRSILQDTAQGLAYLHGHNPPIIHRDLTAKNVLLNSNMQAKIADLGVARILDIRPGQLASTMTGGPGTIAYMPPEAIGPKPRYNTSLDAFSFGVLTLYTIVQSFPDPEAATSIDLQGSIVALTEVQRREPYIEELRRLLGQDHPLEIIVLNCLENKPERRPSIREIIGLLEDLKAQIHDPYRDLTRLDMIQKLSEIEAEKQKLNETLTEKEGKMEILKAKLQELKEAIETKEIKNKELLMDVSALRAQIHTLENEGRSEDSTSTGKKHRGFYSPQRLSSPTGGRHHRRSWSLSARFANALTDSLQRLTKSPSYTEEQSSLDTAAEANPPSKSTKIQPPSLQFKWKRTTDAPFKSSNQTALLGGNVCITGSRLPYIASYSPPSQKWQQFPGCPVEGASPVIFNNQLVLIGGREIHTTTPKATNQLAAWDDTHKQWVYPYPPMHTARCYACAVAYNTWVVAAGGWDYVSEKYERYNSVEVLDGSTLQWLSADPLPTASIYEMSGAILEDEWYLLGGFAGHHPSKVVFSTSLPDLISQAMSRAPISPSSSRIPSITFTSADPKPIWKVLSSTPLRKSTAVTVNNHLLAVGGINDKGKEKAGVHIYMPEIEKWVYAPGAELPSPRSECACIVLPNGELLVTGTDKHRSVDLATIIM